MVGKSDLDFAKACMIAETVEEVFMDVADKLLNEQDKEKQVQITKCGWYDDRR